MYRRFFLCFLALILLAACAPPEQTPNTAAPTPVPTASVSPSPSPEPTPTPAPEPTPETSWAEQTLESMSLYEKLCQLFVVYPESVFGVDPVLSVDESMEQMLADRPVAGFLLDKSNMSDRQQLTGLTGALQAMSKLPLILTCDEEGGRVNRLMSTVGTTWIDAMLSYKDAGEETAFSNAEIIASDLLSCGFTMDLAPVADVWSNPANTVIGDRAYSDDFEQAADLIPSAVAGFHSGGVACVLKHFPGHGDTDTDSHTGAAYVTKTLDELRENELLPFRAGIEAGADAVMIGHLTVPALDDIPALFSPAIVTGLLREELGFTGVVMTDSLEMAAVAEQYTSGEMAVKAIQAGVDLLLCPPDLDDAVQALADAVADGTINEARIDESVLRILTLKQGRD